MLLLRVSEHAYGVHCNKLKPAFCFTAKILPKFEKLKMKLFWMLLSPEVRKMIVKIARNCYIWFSFVAKNLEG
jgi:hypothetical protein